MQISAVKGDLDMSDYIFRKAKQTEIDKCTDLANLAFGFDFRTLLPKVYGVNPVMEAVNFVADNGEFKGFVSVLPERLTVGDTVLKTGYVGSVCVHPDSRGQGIMIKLMDLANTDMHDSRTDIAFLNGNRQRYQYYGFVPAGVTYTFNVHGDNWVHALKAVSADGVTFEEIHPGTELEKKAQGCITQSRCILKGRSLLHSAARITERLMPYSITASLSAISSQTAIKTAGRRYALIAPNTSIWR